MKLSAKKTVVLSNGTRDLLDPLLSNAGMNQLFDVIISVDEVKQYKPTPAAYNHALKQLGVNRDEVK